LTFPSDTLKDSTQETGHVVYDTCSYPKIGTYHNFSLFWALRQKLIHGKWDRLFPLHIWHGLGSEKWEVYFEKLKKRPFLKMGMVMTTLHMMFLE
jgi:hypothetical protein